MRSKFVLWAVVSLSLYSVSGPASATDPVWVDRSNLLEILFQEYHVYEDVDLTMPEATGDGTLTYSLVGHNNASLPSGLAFDPTTRKLSGTVLADQERTGYQYTVTDGDGDKRAFDFLIDISPAPPGVRITETSVTVKETDDTSTPSVRENEAIYTVQLQTNPGSGATVTVTPSSSATGNATVSPSSLVFTPANWNMLQTVTVTGVNDNFDNPNDRRSARITHTVSGYAGVATAPAVDVTVTDDDMAGVTVSRTTLTVEEADDPMTPATRENEATYTVLLDSEPTVNVTVTPSSSATGNATVSPSSLVFTPANWNMLQTVTVTGVNDNFDNPNNRRGARITHTVSGYAGVATAPAVDVTVTDDDMAGVTVSRTTLTVEEADDPMTPATRENEATYTVLLDSEPTVNVTVTPSSSATGNATVSPSSLVFTPANWNMLQTVTVTGVNDNFDNPNDRRSARITHTVSGYAGVATAAAVDVTVTDDDMAGVTVSRTTLTVEEADDPMTPATRENEATYTVLLDSEPTVNVTVTPSSSATGNAAVSPSSLVFTPANWNMLQTVTVTGVNDNFDNPNNRRGARITHTVSGYAGVATAPAVDVTVTDDDMAGVTVSRTTLTVEEADDPMTPATRENEATYTVLLDSEPTVNVTVTPSSSATGNATVSPSSLVFTPANWNMLQTVTVTGVNDNFDNPDDKRSARITHAVSGYAGVTTAPAVDVTVADDDGNGVTVRPTTLTVEEADDPATPAPRENEATYTVVLQTDPGPGATVTVMPTSSATGTATVSPSSLVFMSANWNRLQTVTVTGVNDDLDNSNDRRSARVTHAVSGYASVTTAAAVDVTVTDDDTAEVTVSPTTLTVQEADDPATPSARENETTYTVVLQTDPGPGATVTVTPTSSATGTATVSPSSLVFVSANWNRLQTVTVTGVNDDFDNLNDKRSAQITHAVTGYIVGAITVNVTVIDDDGSSVTVRPTALTIEEGDDPATPSVRENEKTYTITLESRPTANVTVMVTSSSESVAVASPSLLTFTPENWARPQTVMVTAIDDDVDGEDETVTLAHTVSSSDTNYDELSQNVRVTVGDDDTRGVRVSVERLTVLVGSDGTYALVLTSEPTAPVTITVIPSHAIVEVSEANPVFTAFDWDKEQTVTVKALAAGSAELVHRVTSTGDYASVTAPSTKVEIQSSLNDVNEELLPRITQAMMSSTLSAISRRMDMANPNVDSEGPHTFSGQALIEQALSSVAAAKRGTTSLDLRRMLSGKEFVLPFNVAKGETKGTVEVWGRGDYRNLEGGDDRPVRWDGDLTSIHAGIDWKVSPGLLAGVMVSWSDGKFDYQNQGSPRKGTYDSELTSVHPYVSWMSFENALQTWVTIGYGRGEIEINDGNGKHSSDTRLKTAAAGMSAVLVSEHNKIMFGTSTLRVKAEGNITEIKADGGDGINPLTSDIERVRVVLEGRHVCERAPGEWLIPWVEIGARHDGGDGLTGTGVEIGTGVRYSNAAKGLTMEGEARYLVNHSDDYDEWGFHGEIHVDPGADGRGLGFSLAPSLGHHQREVASLWARDGPEMLPESEGKSLQGRLDAEIEYGLPALGGRGLMTPYTHFTLVGGDGDFRVGSRLQKGTSLSLDVSGGRFGQADGSSGLGVKMFVELRF